MTDVAIGADPRGGHDEQGLAARRPAARGIRRALPDRPCSGDLATEVAALAGDCRGAVVAGVSGGCRRVSGLPVWQLPGARHAVHLENPEAFAAAISKAAASA
jgi:pimeloyl-ACP methyl ester carboxylesterase